MVRPCHCDRTAECVFCLRWHTSEWHRVRWGGTPETPPPPQPRQRPRADNLLDVPRFEPPTFTRTRDRCLLTLSIGDRGRELLSISQPIFEDYADRIGADLHVIRVERSDFVCGEKWRAKAYVEQYERTVWLDADIILTPNCPDLFDVVPPGHIALLNEQAIHDNPPTHNIDWIYKEYQGFLDSQQWSYPLPRTVWNSGVYVCDREHAEFLTPPDRPFPNWWCVEQWCETFRIIQHGYKVFELPRAYNWIWWPDRKPLTEPLPDVYVYHWAGLHDHAERISQMRRLAKRFGYRVPDPTAPRNITRPLPCVSLGAIVSSCTSCGDPALRPYRNAHRCEHDDYGDFAGPHRNGIVTRLATCETCPHYEPEPATT